MLVKWLDLSVVHPSLGFPSLDTFNFLREKLSPYKTWVGHMPCTQLMFEHRQHVGGVLAQEEALVLRCLSSVSLSEWRSHQEQCCCACAELWLCNEMNYSHIYMACKIPQSLQRVVSAQCIVRAEGVWAETLRLLFSSDDRGPVWLQNLIYSPRNETQEIKAKLLLKGHCSVRSRQYESTLLHGKEVLREFIHA